MITKFLPSRFILISLLISLALISSCSSFSANNSSQPASDRETISQYSTLGALAQGFYDGEMTVGELKKLGDVGLGTFNGLDGEMIMMNGVIYQVPTSGEPRQILLQSETMPSEQVARSTA